MRKKKNLADALLKKDKSEKVIIDTISKPYVPPSRQGTKQIGCYMSKDAIKQFKFLGVEQEKSIQEMLREAINDYFAKNGKAQIA